MSERPVSDHYNAIAENYHEQYKRENLLDLDKDYPANYFRLQLLINSFVSKQIKRVIEVGVGEGTPLTTLGTAGVDVWGFDISEEMVKKSKSMMANNGMNPDHVFWGDIQDSTTYIHALKDGLFDGVMAMGVMPHVSNDDLVLKNISAMVRPGGSVFIEFRNKLMSMFTFNRYTLEFILDDLLRDVGNTIKGEVRKDLESRLRMDMPVKREILEDTDAPGYDAVHAKFHNPFEVVEQFQRLNFDEVHLHWYHYHPAMPYLEGLNPELFRQEGIKLEHESSNWRGLFLCSAFVVEATKRGLSGDAR